jgi:hypothetical protein
MAGFTMTIRRKFTITLSSDKIKAVREIVKDYENKCVLSADLHLLKQLTKAKLSIDLLQQAYRKGYAE